MPSDAAFASCPLAVEAIDDLPPFLRADPDIRAIVYCHMKEAERQHETLDGLQAELFPQTATELGLPWWETLLRLTVAPVGLSVDDRRDAVIAFIQKSKSSPSGSDWVANVTALVGPSWSYMEHDPDDPDNTPPPYTIRIELPWEPAAGEFLRTEGLIRAITPAHLDIELVFAGGFVLDSSQLDEEAFN